MQAKRESEKGNVNKASQIYKKIGKQQPKILIYIFKDKGLWSSQVVIELEDRIVNNAEVINDKNNRTAIGKAFNKDLL